MSIRFACPACRATLTIATRKAGEKVFCPRCGQPLQVPPAVRRTLLGEALFPTEKSSLQTEQPTLVGAELVGDTSRPAMAPQSDYPDYESPSQGRSNAGLVALGAVLVVVIVGTLTMALLYQGKQRAIAESLAAARKTQVARELIVQRDWVEPPAPKESPTPQPPAALPKETPSEAPATRPVMGRGRGNVPASRMLPGSAQETPAETSRNTPPGMTAPSSLPLPGIPGNFAPDDDPEHSTNAPAEKGLSESELAKINRVDASILKRFNDYRRLAGLPPVTADSGLSEGCMAHAKYLIQNDGESSIAGLGAHDEDSGLVGFTDKGRAAGKASVIASSAGRPQEGWPVSSVDSLIATFYHRVPMLAPGLKRIGIGYATDGRLWQVVINVQTAVDHTAGSELKPVLYPSNNQKIIPCVFGFGADEIPNPIPGNGSGRAAGFPITVSFRQRSVVQDVTAAFAIKPAKNTPNFVATEIPAWLSSPQRPAEPGLLFQGSTICIIPKGTLSPLTTYTVTVTAKVNGKRWKDTWSFTTWRQ